MSIYLIEKVRKNDVQENIKEKISGNVNINSSPSELKITDIRVANINDALIPWGDTSAWDNEWANDREWS